MVYNSMAPQPACLVCNGLDYYLESGFYFCVECHTQSQEIREEVFEYDTNKYGFSKTTIIKNTSKENKVEWTSWEGFNFILKGLTEEIIALGASPTLRFVVLQLWATYLNKLQVAFLSKKICKGPKLNIGHKHKDAEIIFGLAIKNKLKNKKKNKKEHKKIHSGKLANESSMVGSMSYANAKDTARAKRRLLSKSKKELARVEYNKDATNDKDSFEETLTNLENTSIFGGSSVGTFNRKWKKSEIFATRDKRPHDGSISSRNPNFLSRAKLFSLLYLALLHTGDNIHLGDLLRWVREGALSYQHIVHFLPQEFKAAKCQLKVFSTPPPNTSMNPLGLRSSATELAKLIGATSLPRQDLLGLVRRYIGELQLPAKLTTYVERLISSKPLETSSRAWSLPYLEGRAMAWIVVTLKLLLGLDGSTELSQSATAAELNRRLDGACQLFVWTDWVRQTECRRAVLRRFHFPTRDSKARDEYGGTELFLQHYKEMVVPHRHHWDLFHHKGMQAEVQETLRCTLEKLLSRQDAGNLAPEPRVDFTSDLTPQTSHLRAIRSANLGWTAPPILDTDFTATRIDYLLKPKRYVTLAMMLGIELLVSKTSVNRDLGTLEPQLTHRNGEEVQVVIEEEEVSAVNRTKNYANFAVAMGPHSSTPKQEPERGPRARRRKLGGLEGLRQRLLQAELRKREVANGDLTGGSLTLHLPVDDYWFLENQRNLQMSSHEFYSKVAVNFPPSFAWLVQLCSQMIETSVKDLFSEIVMVEWINNINS